MSAKNKTIKQSVFPFCVFLLILIPSTNTFGTTENQPSIDTERFHTEYTNIFSYYGPVTQGPDKEYPIAYQSHYLRGLNQTENEMIDLTRTYKLPISQPHRYVLKNNKKQINAQYSFLYLSYEYNDTIKQKVPLDSQVLAQKYQPYAESIYILNNQTGRVIGYCLIDHFKIDLNKKPITQILKLPPTKEIKNMLPALRTNFELGSHKLEKNGYIEIYSILSHKKDDYSPVLMVDAYFPKELNSIIQNEIKRIIVNNWPYALK